MLESVTRGAIHIAAASENKSESPTIENACFYLRNKASDPVRIQPGCAYQK